MLAARIGASSSTAEQRTLNPQVLGSNPRGAPPTADPLPARHHTSGLPSMWGSMGAGSVPNGGNGPLEYTPMPLAAKY